MNGIRELLTNSFEEFSAFPLRDERWGPLEEIGLWSLIGNGNSNRYEIVHDPRGMLKDQRSAWSFVTGEATGQTFLIKEGVTKPGYLALAFLFHYQRDEYERIMEFVDKLFKDKR